MRRSVKGPAILEVLTFLPSPHHWHRTVLLVMTVESTANAKWTIVTLLGISEMWLFLRWYKTSLAHNYGIP